jgi:flotillin
MIVELSILAGVIIFILVCCFISFYKVVPPTEAHVVASGGGKWVVSSDDKLASASKRAYFAWPLIRKIRILDVTVKDLDITHETYEKNQARYNVRASLKYRIVDPLTASETFTNDEDLNTLLKGVLQSAVRAVTVQYDVTDARANKLEMEKGIVVQIANDLNAWGIVLVNFQLIDFQDTTDSKIISNISKRREVEIESTTREVNAEKVKQAVIKEAEAKQASATREIERDEAIAKREQDKIKTVAEQEKSAQEKTYEVIRVQTIKQAEIDKDRAVIMANQLKDVEAVNKEKKLLQGQGDRQMQEEQAKGSAAKFREDGLAQADAKEALQAALNKFDDKAIRALVAEKIVDMQQAVGIATANALSQADVRAFIGGASGSQGFDLGQVISSLSVSNDSGAQAVLNKIARPNDLGFSGGFKLEVGDKTPTPKPNLVSNFVPKPSIDPGMGIDVDEYMKDKYVKPEYSKYKKVK